MPDTRMSGNNRFLTYNGQAGFEIKTLMIASTSKLLKSGIKWIWVVQFSSSKSSMIFIHDKTIQLWCIKHSKCHLNWGIFHAYGQANLIFSLCHFLISWSVYKNDILIITPANYFEDINEQFLKVLWKGKISRRVSTILKEQSRENINANIYKPLEDNIVGHLDDFGQLIIFI